MISKNIFTAAALFFLFRCGVSVHDKEWASEREREEKKERKPGESGYGGAVSLEWQKISARYTVVRTNTIIIIINTRLWQ